MPVIETKETKKTVFAIFKCKSKECKHTFRVSYQKTTVMTQSELPGGGMPRTDFRHSYVGPSGFSQSYITDMLDCPKCCRQFSACGKMIKGKLVPEKKCGAKCRGAKGASCECSCGGSHHGSVWS